jgi:transposase
VRELRHESAGTKNTWLHLTVRKYRCEDCGRYFHARVPGLLLYRRSTEMFRKEIFTEGFRTKIKLIQRRAYGFKNFTSRSEAKTGFTDVKQRSGNDRLRVIGLLRFVSILCG